MEMLSERQNEERKKFREQMDNDLRVQRDQMNNMMDANMQQAQREREQFLQENQQTPKPVPWHAENERGKHQDDKKAV